MPIKAFAKELKQPTSPRCVLIPVFWLDPYGDSANVRLLTSDFDQGPPSLRKYTHVERQRMVTLRKWEKEVLSRANSPAGQLTYVDAAADGARFYLANMKRVTRDMSHIGPDHGAHGFVNEHEKSRSWWIAEFGEKFTAVQSFQPVRKGPRFRCLCFPSPV